MDDSLRFRVSRIKTAHAGLLSPDFSRLHFAVSSRNRVYGSETGLLLKWVSGYPPLQLRHNRSLPGTEPYAGSYRSGRSHDILVVVISTQEAFDCAKQYATELLGEREYTLEEFEQDVYKNRRVWRITLGFPKRRIPAPDLMRSIAASLPLEYKTILVDLETGEPVAMKLAS